MKWFKWDLTKQPEHVTKIENVLDSGGWEIIEDYIKQIISNEYADFMNATPDNLIIKQIKVQALFNLMEKIYALGGRKWTWEGWKQVENLIPEESPSPVNEKRDEYFRSMDPKEEPIG